MKLFHWSPHNFNIIKKNKAEAKKWITVPENELLNGIYLTQSYEFALAIASMPEGLANIDHNKKTIKFENPEKFNPEKEVYVYEIDSNKIEEQNLKYVDEYQYALLNVSELKPDKKHIHKAGDVKTFFELNV